MTYKRFFEPSWPFHQAVGEDDYYGFNDATADPDPAEAAFAVNTIATLFNGV